MCAEGKAGEKIGEQQVFSWLSSSRKVQSVLKYSQSRLQPAGCGCSWMWKPSCLWGPECWSPSATTPGVKEVGWRAVCLLLVSVSQPTLQLGADPIPHPMEVREQRMASE